MRVSVIQMNSGPDKAANLEQAKGLIEAAIAADRPDLVSLPETMTVMGGPPGTREAAAETIPGGEAYALLQDLARRHGVNIHGGSFFERTESRLFNTTLLFDRGGREVARYRKIHLFDVTTPDGKSYRESDYTGRGDEVVMAEIDGVPVGLTICYDVRFAELYRRLQKEGARLILVPSAFTLQTGKDHWDVLLRARAIDTQCYIAAAAQWGSFPTTKDVRQSWGHSMVVDPWGHVMAQVPDKTGFATATLDFDHQDRIRRNLPVASHHVLAD